jgi:hypothetical protein
LGFIAGRPERSANPHGGDGRDSVGRRRVLTVPLILLGQPRIEHGPKRYIMAMPAAADNDAHSGADIQGAASRLEPAVHLLDAYARYAAGERLLPVNVGESVREQEFYPFVAGT